MTSRHPTAHASVMGAGTSSAGQCGVRLRSLVPPTIKGVAPGILTALQGQRQERKGDGPMPTDRSGPRVSTRAPLNLAELVDQGQIELTDLVLADAATLLAVELELLEQLAQIERRAVQTAAARERLLGYAVQTGVGDLHDFVERRLVTEYLIATGVDAVVLPLVAGRSPYSHIARDAGLVAINGEIAPEAIIHRLTSCPRMLLYGLDSDGAELRGRLVRRLVPVTAPGWPDRARYLAEGPSAADPSDLRDILAAAEQGKVPPAPAPQTLAARRVTTADRRRARRLRLNGFE